MITNSLARIENYNHLIIKNRLDMELLKLFKEHRNGEKIYLKRLEKWKVFEN